MTQATMALLQPDMSILTPCGMAACLHLRSSSNLYKRARDPSLYCILRGTSTTRRRKKIEESWLLDIVV